MKGYVVNTLENLGGLDLRKLKLLGKIPIFVGRDGFTRGFCIIYGHLRCDIAYFRFRQEKASEFNTFRPFTVVKLGCF